MLTIRLSNKFKKDYKKAIKRGCKIDKLNKITNLLANEMELPEKFHDHKLQDTNLYINVRECHIEPDWLLIYRIEKDVEILRLIRTGSHSDLF